MDSLLILLILTLLFSYIYAFIGGFTDAANAIATSVGSRALSPLTAVLMAGFLEIVGALTGTAVALTIGRGLVSLEQIPLYMVLAALMGTMAWSLFTYYFGIPVSETHGLVGAVIGAAVATSGFNVIIWDGLTKVLIAILASPLLGFLGGLILMKILYISVSGAKASRMNFIFKNLQRFSAAFMAFSHGRNDAQKPMGVLVMALAIYFGWNDPSVPLWVILSVGFAAGLGVFYGGWRIIRTLGMKLTKLTCEQGFAAETSAASVLQLASFFGIPVSTTHTITSSITGVGVARRFKSVRWYLALDIAISWVLTLPVTILLGYSFAIIIGFFF